jgi:two-component system, NtrC family, response regulator
MDDAFLKQLSTHHWKGNIRELKNVIERAVIITGTSTLTADLLPFGFAGNAPITYGAFDLATLEKQHISNVLAYTKGNKTETARLLNIGLTTLYRKIEEYHLKA